MPRYEYHCESCGKTFEATQRMSDPPLTSCTCGSHGTVKRLMSAGNGLIFKGSGFYITDYKNGGSNSSTAAPTPAKSESKTETTTAPTCGAGACAACSE